MRYLTIEQRESLRDALKSRAASLRTDLGTKLRHSRRPACGSLANRIEAAPESVDEALDAVAAEMEDPEARTEVQQLRAIRQTLARLRAPDYGMCADCDGDIPFIFLRADPSAGLCRQCRQRRDLAPFVPHEM